MAKSLFDKIVQPKAKKETTKCSKKVASSNPEVKGAVDQVIRCKAVIAKTKAEQEQFETTIIEHVKSEQDTNAFKGEYSKTYLVEGHEGNLTYTTADSFSIPQDDISLDALKDLLGNNYYSWFKTKRVISLKENIDSNEKLINSIFKCIEDAGLNIGDVFDAEDIVVACDDLDRKQYDLDPDTLEIFRSIVKQRKAALK